MIKDWHFNLILTGFVVLSLYIMVWATSLPDAHFSNATGECVQVINHDRNNFYTCDTLPKRYNHYWVE